MSRPWTKGPWRSWQQDVGFFLFHTGPRNDPIFVLQGEIDTSADAELITLAPEMAEIILSHATRPPDGECYPAQFGDCPICEMAVHIQKIEASDE